MAEDMSISKDKRVFFVGINTGLLTSGMPDKRYVEFYELRSSKDLYCAIIGNVVVPDGYGTNSATPVLTRDRIWPDLAKAVKARGTRPGIQLSTTWSGYKGARKFVAKDAREVIRASRDLVNAIDDSSVEKILSSFELASAMALDQGFEHIQIHAAHGYLLGLLVDKRIYAKAEKVLEWLAVQSARLRSMGSETSIRISLRSGEPNFDSHGREVFLTDIVGTGFDLVDLSSGFYNIDKRLIYPSREEIISERFADGLSVASHFPDQQFIMSGRIFPKRKELPSNVHIGLCRDLLANPNFLSEPEWGCKNNGKCHYYSRGEEHVSCQRWTETTGQR
ncbi:hypothetical protein [Martelella endophytica]|uniref:oxidoreductase n=1 Tax=Martelella endophytica TaxID=1486262 RepID=UPI000ADE45D2|nr:hypothetical protein [Martelella endophytica]